MGGTVGIAVGQTIYTSILKRKINRIPNLSGFDTSPAGLSDSVRTLHTLPVSDKAEVLFLICSCYMHHFYSNLNEGRSSTPLRNLLPRYGSSIRLLLESGLFWVRTQRIQFTQTTADIDSMESSVHQGLFAQDGNNPEWCACKHGCGSCSG